MTRLELFRNSLSLYCSGRIGDLLEPRQLHRNSFEWFDIEKGHFAGTSALKLKGTHLKQKGKASNLKNDTKKAHLLHVNHLPILKIDAVFCQYMMLKLQIDVLMPAQRLLTQDCG